MRILLTNDDGIHAPGLKVLERIAAALSDDVYVVAPETDQSGVAHSLSLNDPLRLRQISARHYAVKGTPTDCVLMGVRHVLKGAKPDLILSGVNRGHNVAEDVTYSGTIAGAMEGTLLGIPSIALSQSGHKAKEMHWTCAEQHGPAVIRKVLATGVPDNVLVNVNFPACPPQDVKGVAITLQGRRDANILGIEERIDGRGNPYFWLVYQPSTVAPAMGTDIEALAAHKISVTPLRLDLTDEPSVTSFARAFA
ncbi:5'/3'-nucleotidase SurE [Methylovirgula sp. 4M-Z18]|uniref:5'/3'-nucleotidase SurE n=1 Tax=Methylovirgula sp. 4M-Z18 TaxID=2293567 RepID=UPI000E2EEA20|nr:5'/3'-nucleotidase SurE [Methylovirgula sp. 4M-Z18]RFB81031.1 5'/3'-nucleotidase SurE [Methylovirgula sp. 4M-Z18]